MNADTPVDWTEHEAQIEAQNAEIARIAAEMVVKLERGEEKT